MYNFFGDFAQFIQQFHAFLAAQTDKYYQFFPLTLHGVGPQYG